MFMDYLCETIYDQIIQMSLNYQAWATKLWSVLPIVLF